MQRLLIFVLLLAFFASGWGKVRMRRSTRPWSFSATVEIGYDDNILKYSTKYLSRFEQGQDAGRFHLKSRDDLLTNLRLELNYQIFRRTEMGLALIRHNYLRNSIKNWTEYRLQFRQALGRRMAFSFSAGFIPDFYVRHYRDEDWVNLYGYQPITFQPFSFAKNNYGLWWQVRLLKHSLLRLYGNYMQYYHNQHFTEYDSDNYLYGVSLFQSLSRRLKGHLGFRYIKSRAEARDSAGEDRFTADDADASYRQVNYLLGLDLAAFRFGKRRTSLSIDLQYQRRAYQSERFLETDPLHAGRKDDNWRIETKFLFWLSGNLRAGFYYNWYYRDSDSVSELNRDLISDEKDYRQAQVGLLLHFKWRK